MIPTRPTHVAEQLAAMDFNPSRVLGQNFLVDQNILGIILDAAAPTPRDIILEIGAGLGVLTRPLSERAAEVFAIEKDQRLYTFLQTELAGTLNLELIQGDATEMDLDAVLARNVNKVVANLPYSVASRLIVDLALSSQRPERIVVTVQKEVGQRLVAAPRRKAYGALSVLTQMFYTVELRKTIRPRCFYPPPQVDSALVKMVLRDRPLADIEDEDRFVGLTKHLFSQRRKQLGTILRNAPACFRIDPADFDFTLRPFDMAPRQRPDSLRPEQIALLANALAQEGKLRGSG